MKELKETHMQGMITIENRDFFPENLIYGDIGIQISDDKRIWICINGIAFLRFKPIGEQNE